MMNKPVNTEMLILARESRGMTQSQLAKASSISQGNISKYEGGLLKISEEHLQKIAEVVDYPLAFFFLPEERYGFGSSCTYHRKRQTLPLHELKTLLAKTNIHRIHIAHLLNGVEIEGNNQFQRLDVEDFDGNVERIAGLVRDGWHLPFGPVKNLVRSIEMAGGIVFMFPFGTRKLDAISQWLPDKLPDLPPIFLINSDMLGERIRFTLAHELGHVIMHQVLTDNREQEADRFAAEFLMPARDIAPDLKSLTFPNLIKLKGYWKVSMAAIIKRAADLEKITPRQYRTLFEQMSMQGYRINEPNPIPTEEPTVIKDIINVYLNEHGYTIAELAKLLAMNEQEAYSEYIQSDRKLRIVGGLRKSLSDNSNI